MDGKFTHYLVTRFNVRIEGYGPEYFQPGIRNPAWEWERLPLFEQFCAPSVAAQRSRNFTWLIYLDISTDPEILHEIRRIIEPVPSVSLLFVQDYQEMIAHLKELCAGASTEYVITSRLDNDDGIGMDYIQKVQENFQSSDRLVLNLSGGVIYNMDKGILTHLHQSLNNSFISLIEKVQSPSELITIYGFRHLNPPSTVRVKNIPYPHAFWMNLHQHNAGPRSNRGRPSWPSRFAAYYAIDFTHVRISFFNTLSYTMRWFPNAMLNKFKRIFHPHS